MSKGMYTYEVIILLCFSTALVNTLTRSVCHYNGVSSKKPIEPELIITATDTTYIYKSDENFAIFEKWKK